jgi:hypothetical protein
MYGYFTHGTDPPPRPYSSGFLSLPNRLRRLPSPAHFRRRLPGHAVFAALVVLHSRPSTDRASLAISLSLIGLLTPVPPGDSASPPEVTHYSSVPCHPQTPWCGGVNENAFAFIVQARPCPTFGRPVHLGVAPIDYSPVLLLMPFGFHLTMDTLPSRELQVGGFRFTLICFQLSPSCPVRLLHTSTFSGPRGVTPAFGYSAPHLSVRGTSTLLSNALLSAPYDPLRHPAWPSSL